MKSVKPRYAEAASDDLDADSEGERLASNLHNGQKVTSVLQEDALDNNQTESGSLAFAAAMTEEDPNGNAELCSSATADFR
jgi:hypothetical protein